MSQISYESLIQQNRTGILDSRHVNMKSSVWISTGSVRGSLQAELVLAKTRFSSYTTTLNRSIQGKSIENLHSRKEVPFEEGGSM